MNKLKISFKEYQWHMGKLCRDIANSGWRPDYVVGITRGGLLPAVMISHYFDVPCETLKVSLRDGGSTEHNTWMAEDAFGYVDLQDRELTEGEISSPENRKNILIVDDINDSGATINWIMEDWQNCMPTSSIWDSVWNQNVKFAVVVDNLASNCNVKMDFCGCEINKAENNTWIDFPYEEWWAK